jgi:hypothetical protein
LAAEGTTLAIGVSTVRTGLDQTGVDYAEAQVAAEHVRATGGVLALPALRVFDWLTLFGRETRCAAFRVRAPVRRRGSTEPRVTDRGSAGALRRRRTPPASSKSPAR